MLNKTAIQEFKNYLKERNRSESTINEYSKDLEMFSHFLSSIKKEAISLSQVKSSDLTAYLDMLVVNKRYKPQSRNRQMNSLRSFFKFCKKRDLIDKNPAESLEPISVEHTERSFLNNDEVNQLIITIDHRLIKLVVLTLFYTGLRITECLSLKLEDIDFTNNRLIVQKGKGNKKRIIPLHNELKGVLQSYIDKWRVKGPSNLLFLTERSGKLSDVYVNKVLRDTVHKLGWKKKITCHLLRHSFASALVKNNVNIVAVKELLGHASLKTTSVYTHIQQQCMVDAIRTLEL
jgi:site-specific recombinase XerD